MKHLKLITEMYKPATKYIKNDFGWDVPVRTFVDDVFDGIKHIISEVEHVSEKSFKQLDEIHKRTEEMFDNNSEILVDIDRLNDKRYQYVAEYIYDKYFITKKEVIDYEN